MALFTVLMIILLIHIGGSRTSSTTRDSTSCSVPLCAIGNCSSRPLCYEFQTSTNQPLCAPPVICSLFDPCMADSTQCTSNTSVCVVNSCCASPICMPLALNVTCTTASMSTSTLRTSTASTPTTFRVINTTLFRSTTRITSKVTSTTLSRSTTRITSKAITTTLATPSTTVTSTLETTASTISLFCTWSLWVSGRCSVTCGTGAYIRQRYCLDQFSYNCTSCAENNDTVGTRPCYYPSCTGK